MRLALLSALCLLPAAMPAAHCACGGDAFPGAALSAETVAAGGVTLGWGFGYSAFEQVSRADFEKRARQSSAGRHEGPAGLAAADLSLTWGLADGWQLGLAQTWQRMEQYREGVVVNGVYEQREHGDLGGLKDLDLSLKARLARGAWGALAAQAGLAIPTGSQVQSPLAGPDPAGNSLNSRALDLPAWVQPGRGSLDGSVSLAYSYDAARWLADFSLSQSLPSTTRGYRSGEQNGAALALGWKFREHGVLYADFIQLQSASDTQDGRRVWATGGAFLGAGARLSLAVAERNQVSAQLLWPLLFGTAGEEGTRVALQGSLRWATLF
jgi:hypothetical protein